MENQYIVVIIIFCVFAAYIFLKRKKTGSSIFSGDLSVSDFVPFFEPSNVLCEYGKNNDGSCFYPPLCGGKMQPLNMNCNAICDPVVNEWRCQLECENSDNPFPSKGISDRPLKDIKCDENNLYYVECQNGGKMYNGSTICSCPPGFGGDKCQYNYSACLTGTAKPNQFNTDYICLSCCDRLHSKDGKCEHFGERCEDKCGNGFVYDIPNMSCVCPAPLFVVNQAGNCVNLTCSIHGELTEYGCTCAPGYTGLDCSESICGINGSPGPDGDCICNDGYFGDKCQYDSTYCGSNGTPVWDKKSKTLSCVCRKDPISGKPLYEGKYCQCSVESKPKGSSCLGTGYVCNDANRDESEWLSSYLTCEQLYNNYTNVEMWKKTCGEEALISSGIAKNSDDAKKALLKGYIPQCTNPVNKGSPVKFSSLLTCNTIPHISQIQDCIEFNAKEQGSNKLESEKNKCLLPKYLDDTGQIVEQDTSGFFDHVCVCKQNANNTIEYKSVPVNINNNCGPEPYGMCKQGGYTVHANCISYDNKHYMWNCPNQLLPKDLAKTYFSVSERESENTNVKWYGQRTDLGWKVPVFPTINCDFDDGKEDASFTLLNRNQLEAGIGYQSFNGPAGMILKPKNSVDKPRLIPYGTTGYLMYNLRNASVAKDGKLYGTPIADPDADPIVFQTVGVGCQINTTAASPFSHPDTNYMGCAVDDQNKPLGEFTQYCSDFYGNIMPCDQEDPKPFYRSDIGYCARCKDYIAPNGIAYPTIGKYCQYDRFRTCNNRGDPDKNGLCDCDLDPSSNTAQYFTGGSIGSKTQCKFSSGATCSNHGRVSSNGLCTCEQDFYTLCNVTGGCNDYAKLGRPSLGVLDPESGRCECVTWLNMTGPSDAMDKQCANRHCEVGGWKPCIESQKKQFRDIIKPVDGRGNKCPPLEQECSSCYNGTWSSWSACRGTGVNQGERGKQTRRRKVIQAYGVGTSQCLNGENMTGAPLGRALNYSGAEGVTNDVFQIQEQDCNNCKYFPYGDWSNCTNGIQTRRRSIIHSTGQNTSSCQTSPNIRTLTSTESVSPMQEEKQNCSDCVYGAWDSWDNCNYTGGFQFRRRYLTPSTGYGTSPCINPNERYSMTHVMVGTGTDAVRKLEQTQNQDCSDCHYGAWGDWGSWKPNHLGVTTFYPGQCKDGKETRFRKPIVSKGANVLQCEYKTCEGDKYCGDGFTEQIRECKDCVGKWEFVDQCKSGKQDGGFMGTRKRRYKIVSKKSGNGQNCPFEDGYEETVTCDDAADACVESSWRSRNGWGGCNVFGCNCDHKYQTCRKKPEAYSCKYWCDGDTIIDGSGGCA